MATHSMDRVSLASYSPWGCRESDTTERTHTGTYIYSPYICRERQSYISLSLLKMYSSFFFGCTGSLLLCAGLLQLQQVRAALCCDAQLLILVASLVASTGSRRAGSVVAAHGLSCLVHSTQNLSRPGTESVSPTLAAGFVTPGPPGKPQSCVSLNCLLSSSTRLSKRHLTLNMLITLTFDFHPPRLVLSPLSNCQQ